MADTIDPVIAEETTRLYSDTLKKNLDDQDRYKGDRNEAIQESMSRLGISEEKAKDKSNWDPVLADKVKKSHETYVESGEKIKRQRQLIAGLIDQNPDNQRILEKTLPPGEINKSLALNGSTTQKEQVIEQRAKDISNENTLKYDRLDSNKADKQLKINEIDAQLTLLDPETDSKQIENLKEQKKQLEFEKEKIQKQQDEMIENGLLNDDFNKQQAQKEYDDQDPTSVANLEKSNKLSNTGFEQINNYAPFYMQFPTLQSISDFRLRNGASVYGKRDINDIARDAINFRIFEAIPGVARAEKVKGTSLIRNVIDDSGIRSLGAFTIYPSHSDGMGAFSQRHTHEYSGGSEDWISNIASTVGGVFEGIDSMMKVLDTATQALNKGSLTGLNPSGNVYQRKMETLKFYQNSAPQTMSINFNLFTKKDFLSDVFRPIMFLTALGYPKRALSGETSGIFENIINNLVGWSQQGNNWAQNLINTMKQNGILDGANKLVGNASKFESLLGSFGGFGPYRYFISKRPEFLSMRHASGLFNFPLANITNFEYTFKGPWYNYTGNPILEAGNGGIASIISDKVKNFTPDPNKPFKERMDSIFKNFASEVGDVIKGPTANTGPVALGTPDELSYLLNKHDDLQNNKNLYSQYAYPSQAECTLTIQSSVPFFRDDYMSLFYGSQKSAENLVKVTQQNTGDTRFFGTTNERENQTF